VSAKLGNALRACARALEDRIKVVRGRPREIQKVLIGRCGGLVATAGIGDGGLERGQHGQVDRLDPVDLRDLSEAYITGRGIARPKRLGFVGVRQPGHVGGEGDHLAPPIGIQHWRSGVPEYDGPKQRVALSNLSSLLRSGSVGDAVHEDQGHLTFSLLVCRREN
jgi:hypothetical protein